MSFHLSSESEHSDGEHDQPPARDTPEPNHRRTHEASQESHVGPIRRARGSETAPVRPGRAGRSVPTPVSTRMARAAPSVPGEVSRPGRLPPAPGLTQPIATAGPTSPLNPITNRPVLEGWPQAVVAMNHQDEPVNDEFIDLVEGIFQLQGAYADLAEQLAYVPAPRQYVVIIYSMLAFRQASERLTGALVTIQRPLPTTETTTPSGRGFHYTSVFSEAINAQSNQFKQDYLPRGYIDGELGALGSVDTFVRGKLRNSRGKIRDLLLTNIQAGAGREILQPVPTISALLVQMKASFTPPIPGAPAPPEPRGNESLLKARLAYLRIQTIIQFGGRGGGDVGRQWKNIDEHLCELSLKQRAYRLAFYQLVLAYDHATFGHDLWTEMDVTSIALPTKEQISARMEANALANEPPLLDNAADV
ncbi:hypothetical protein PtA15_3A706 [Puccinia triticina]|uniref:Uncharacterized protein n=1 Tax=Puccinia triticina TaxID=208348 RepID=A0ABY7CGQ7_9BASI|nr:uncharacterized protein PtA15_3A706 [Puccinia triticina]WAQ83336.1 hypothetical protein PtA15_3A706 [Puccinia triticina]